MLLEPPVGLAARQLYVSPATVVVGPGALTHLGPITRRCGGRALVVAGANSWRACEADLAAQLLAHDANWKLELYRPDCTEGAAERAVAAASAHGATLIIGVGGGKALDLAKLVGDMACLPVVTVPTSAATCAAWTALGNFYTEAGAFDHGRSLPRCPAGVLVDTTLIARAPARLLAAGLADTLAKWYETSASVRYEAADMGTRAAWTMARFLKDEIRAWGQEAYGDALAGRHTPAVDRAIETNICLAGTVGGLGGERCRSVAAHAVCNALTTMPGNAGSWHGEKVAFGILVQLLLEGREEEATDLARFFASIGVPVTLSGLGYRLDAAQLDAVAAHVCRPASTVHHLPFAVTPDRVRAAAIQADRLGLAVSEASSGMLKGDHS